LDSTLPYITKRIIDNALGERSASLHWRLCAAYCGIFAMIPCAIWLFITKAGVIATGFAHDIRAAAFEKLQELSFSYFDERPIGWLMARLTSDVQRLSNVLPWFCLDIAWGSVYLAGVIVWMFVLSWKLALWVLSIVPALAVLSIVFQRKLIRSQRQVRKTNSKLTAAYNEGIAGERTTKILVREENSLAEFRELSGEMADSSRRNLLQSALYLPMVMALGSFGVALTLWRGGATLTDEVGTVAAAAGVSFGTLVAFMQYALQFHVPVQEMAQRFTQMQIAQASAERLVELFATVPEIRDSEAVRRRIAACRGGSGTKSEGAAPESTAVCSAIDGGAEGIGRIEFQGVSFAYKTGEPVLTDFDLTVTAGETIALVGATGSGKTTIASLVARFYEPTAGRILFDGVDYRERSLKWLQSHLGIVLQTPHLFSGTVRENIRYGSLDATDEEVEAAARRVGAHDALIGLEKGYDTEVGESGVRLSMGERQFVALARAVLADPQILIMDEATSSVDTETEQLIQKGVERVLDGRIAFIIAHRLSTIRNADRILVIDKGRILEEGSHVELLARRGHY
ncbi:MAG: ABC transporter ATP-binding protein, partial [Planctomycetes bacterium]|nr:ABC transporter ATP-binding protein [Planctomycetota bacterium]